MGNGPRVLVIILMVSNFFSTSSFAAKDKTKNCETVMGIIGNPAAVYLTDQDREASVFAEDDYVRFDIFIARQNLDFLYSLVEGTTTTYGGHPNFTPKFLRFLSLFPTDTPPFGVYIQVVEVLHNLGRITEAEYEHFSSLYNQPKWAN
jgi:hypothetical protein